jgi:hypothetical protein
MNRCSRCQRNATAFGRDVCGRCERNERLLAEPVFRDQEEKEVVVSERLLLEGSSSVGGAWTKAQFALLGISCPPPQGWKFQILGTLLSREAAEEFVRLKKQKPLPTKQRTLWDS